MDPNVSKVRKLGDEEGREQAVGGNLVVCCTQEDGVGNIGENCNEEDGEDTEDVLFGRGELASEDGGETEVSESKLVRGNDVLGGLELIRDEGEVVGGSGDFSEGH